MNSTPTPSNIALSYVVFSGAVMGKLLGIVGQEPSVTHNPAGLHVSIFRFCFHSSEVYSSIDSSKWSVILLKSPTSTGDFSNPTGSSVTNHRFSPDIVPVFHQMTVRCNDRGEPAVSYR
jgi:hypothetical protein